MSEECNDCHDENKGNRGPRGFRGEQGVPGPAGSGSSIQGPKGDTGDPGLNGSIGPAGLSAYAIWKLLPGNSLGTEQDFIDSLKGDDGVTPNIVVGTVTAGGSPGVTAVTVGNTVTLNFVLAQGPQGIPGVGTAGPQGIAGPNSLVFKRFAAIATLGAWGDNTGNFTTATVININKTSLLGYTGVAATALNANTWNQGIVENSIIQITSRVDSTKFGIYLVSSIVDNASYFSYTVSVIAANGSSSTVNEESIISYNIPGVNTISTASVTIPIGVVWPTAKKNGATLPTGWLLCDGTAYAIATYPALYAEIGLTYAVLGDPLTVFRVPDLVDKIPYGCIDGDVGVEVGNNTSSLAVTGTASVSISAANLPEHTHGISGLTISSDGSHAHNYHTSDAGGGSATHADSGGAGDDHTVGTDSAGAHSHTISGTLDNEGIAGTTTATGTIAGAGSGDNRQKGLSLRFMIKY